MPRETKLERLERENRDLSERLDSMEAWAKRESADARHLRDRCTVLYNMAMKFAEEAARVRLAEAGPSALDGTPLDFPVPPHLTAVAKLS